MKYTVVLLITLVIMALIGFFGKGAQATSRHGQIRVEQVFYDQNNSVRIYAIDDENWATPCMAITSTSGTSITCR